MEVSINPAFLLFVSGNEVIGYQALNDDAKQIEDRCALVGRGIEGAVEDIVKMSHQDGFLKDGGEVKLTVVSANCAKSEADAVLDRATHTAKRVAQECNISIKSDIRVETDVAFAPESKTGRLHYLQPVGLCLSLSHKFYGFSTMPMKSGRPSCD